MGRLGSSLLVLAAALLAAQLGRLRITYSLNEQNDAVAGLPMLFRWSPGALLQRSGLAAGRGALTHAAAGPTADVPRAPIAWDESRPEAVQDYKHLKTYYLSATSLQLRPASPQQHPATHVARLPLSGLSPLTAASYMPKPLDEMSSTGIETFMVRTVEWFKNQAAASRLLDAWEAAGWVDPWSGAVTPAHALPTCGSSLARRRGYGSGTLAARAAAAYRPPGNITAMAVAHGVAALRVHCPQSLMLTHTGSAAAAVADVLDVVLVPEEAHGSGEAVELLLRVVDNPWIIAEHDPGHPVHVIGLEVAKEA